MDYTDIEAVENYLLVTIEESYKPQVQAWIAAVSATIDRMANRVICRDEEETWTFDGDGSRILHIGDWNSIEELTIDGVEVTAYTLYPQNRPYSSRIVLTDRTFSRGVGTVTLKGIPAMTSVLPEDIKLAATILVAEIAKTNMTSDAFVANEKIGNYQAQYSSGGSGELVTLDSNKREREKAEAIIKRYCRIAI